MNYFTIYKYTDQLYQIKDALGVLSTLVIGEEKALLFDTGYGIGDLKSEIKNITTKELIVVNSHGHMDHCCGNYQFDKVYISKKDMSLCKMHNSQKWRKRNYHAFLDLKLDYPLNEEEYINHSYGNIVAIDDNMVFDLGKLNVQVIEMGGHTQGSIGLYIDKWKLLLASDASCPFVWLFLEESKTVSEYVLMLKTVLKLDFENFLVGHGATMFPKSKMYDFLNIASSIDLKESKKVTFKNFENLDSYCYTHDEMYDQRGCGIIFDPKKL